MLFQAIKKTEFLAKTPKIWNSQKGPPFGYFWQRLIFFFLKVENLKNSFAGICLVLRGTKSRVLVILALTMHCNFFSRNQHDCQSCWIIYISSDVIFTTDSWIHLTDVVQMYYDSSTSYQLYCTLWKIFYYLQKVCLHGKSTSLQS